MSGIEASFRTIQALETSWNETAKALGSDDPDVVTQPLLKKLLLTTRENGTLQFQRKPERQFWDSYKKVFCGEKSANSFKEGMQKIKALYASIKGPLSQDNEKMLYRFEEKINRLGRYVYAARCEKTSFFFKSPQFQDYQLRYSTPQTLLAPTVIKRGLPNPNGKLCWLNASVKYMASHTAYDPLLLTPAKTPKFEELRLSLLRLIDALRRNWDARLINALHEELIEAIRKSRLASFLTDQSDAAEFLLRLQDYLSDSVLAKSPIRVATINSSTKEGTFRGGKEMDRCRLMVNPAQEPIIDVEACLLNAFDEVNSQDYYIEARPATKQDGPAIFLERSVCTRYPDYLEINLKRGMALVGQENLGVLDDQRIQLQAGGTLKLTEYEPIWKSVDNKPLLVDAKPKTLCTFQVISAIEHQGVSSLEGHYVTYTRDPQGVVITHNDGRVIPNKSEEVWTRSYHFLLHLISREPNPKGAAGPMAST